MKQKLSSVLVAVAVFAVSAFSATAAQAAEGPFYKIAGSRLLSSESKQAKISGSITIIASDGSPTPIRYECSNVKTTEAKLLGSTGANSAASENQFVEWSSCILTGNGENCKGTFPLSSEPLVGKLVYSGSGRTGVIGLQLLPVSGKHILNLTFSGTCMVSSMSVSGSVAGELRSGGKPVEVGSEPAEASQLEVRFPSEPIKNVWSEVSGTLVEAMPAVKALGKEAGFEGTLRIELTSGSKWGVYTK